MSGATAPNPSAPTIAHVNLARGFRGGERQTELLIRELAARGVRQRLVHRAGSRIGARLGGVNALERIGVGFPWLHRVGAFHSADVIHAHDGKAVGLAVAASMVNDRGVVITRRIDRTPSATTSSLLSRADVLVGLSRGVVASLERATGRDDIRRIPSAHAELEYDPSMVEGLRARDEGRLVVLSAGAYEFGQKGLDHLMEAARLLERTNPEIRIRTLGRGPDEDRLRALAAPLANVEIGGWAHNLGDHLRAADVFVLPSNHEGLGSVLLDAFAAGLPIVSTRIPGPVDVVEHEVNGLLVSPGNAVDLAAGLKRVADDDLLRSRLSARARSTSEEFTAAKMADRYMALYEGLLRRRSA